jgi:hypothetical protein
MRKIVALIVLGALAVAVPAHADKPHHPPPKPAKPKPPKPPRCAPHNAGYKATGTLVASSLAPIGHHRFSGTIEVDVTKANHHAPTGEQTFTLSGAKVKFHRGIDPAAPAAGSKVGLHGKITELPKSTASRRRSQSARSTSARRGGLIPRAPRIRLTRPIRPIQPIHPITTLLAGRSTTPQGLRSGEFCRSARDRGRSVREPFRGRSNLKP